MTVKTKGMCDERGATIDPSKEGYGHRRQPMCGGWTYTVNPEVLQMIRDHPDASGEELAALWIKKLLGEA